jgi:NADH-quinone oxidoreductase subunit K
MEPASQIPIVYLNALSAALFFIGMFGFLIRRNLIVLLMSIEIMLNAVNLNLVAFSNHASSADGQVFAIFIITVAAAEAATGLAILVSLFRISRAVNVDEISNLKW